MMHFCAHQKGKSHRTFSSQSTSSALYDPLNEDHSFLGTPRTFVQSVVFLFIITRRVGWENVFGKNRTFSRISYLRRLSDPENLLITFNISNSFKKTFRDKRQMMLCASNVRGTDFCFSQFSSLFHSSLEKDERNYYLSQYLFSLWHKWWFLIYNTINLLP